MAYAYQNPWMQSPYGTPYGAPYGAAYPGYYPQPGPYSTAPPEFSGPSPFGETSYIENILRMNRGKTAVIYMNFEDSQWGSKIFKGVILGAGKDHILLEDKQTGIRYLLLTIYLNYITFEEEIEYEYPYR